MRHQTRHKDPVLSNPLLATAVVLLMALLASSPANGSTPLLSTDWSSDLTITAFGADIRDHDVVSDGGGIVTLGNLPLEVDVDGFHRSGSADPLFSLDVTTSRGGVIFRPGDVASYDGVGYGLAFDAAAAGVPPGVNVDALSAYAGKLILSFDTTVLIGGMTFADEDLVLYDGAALSLFFDASLAGVPDRLDLDAVHVLYDTRVLVSFDVGGEVGGVSFTSNDVLEYDPDTDTWEINFQTNLGGANVDALAATADSDADGLINSADNCITTVNPDQRDTDSDGIGNACDPDLNDDCFTNIEDLVEFKAVFFTSDDDADFNGDGFVSLVDLVIFKSLFFMPPGPSGVPNICW